MLTLLQKIPIAPEPVLKKTRESKCLAWLEHLAWIRSLGGSSPPQVETFSLTCFAIYTSLIHVPQTSGKYHSMLSCVRRRLLFPVWMCFRASTSDLHACFSQRINICFLSVAAWFIFREKVLKSWIMISYSYWLLWSGGNIVDDFISHAIGPIEQI